MGHRAISFGKIDPLAPYDYKINRTRAAFFHSEYDLLIMRLICLLSTCANQLLKFDAHSRYIKGGHCNFRYHIRPPHAVPMATEDASGWMSKSQHTRPTALEAPLMRRHILDKLLVRPTLQPRPGEFPSRHLPPSVF